MNVAIPILDNCVAPCFEAATNFKIFKIKGSKISSIDSFQCKSNKGFILIKLLEIHDTDVLICNGIKDFLKDQLISIGITVITDINDTIEMAMGRFLAHEIKERRISSLRSPNYNSVLHEDLVCWTNEIFESNGFEVTSLNEIDYPLTDLIAKINCPVCGKPIKVALCCGAQTYRADQEISEFVHRAKSRFNSCAYVYMDDPAIEECCNKYGIEYLRPDKTEVKKLTTNKTLIPILTRPIDGHNELIINTNSITENIINPNSN